MRKFGAFLCGMAIISAGYAMDDCLAYKLNPNIYLQIPEWSKEVVQPIKHMDLLHGNVAATFTDNYEIVADVTNIEDGFCVSLKSIEATVGYTNFLVKIDIRHTPDTCSYNVVLSHEDEHIRAYLSVIDDFKDELEKSIYNAADSIMPIFVRDMSDIDSVITMLNQQIHEHPDVVLINQKIHAAEEIRNKQIDMNDDGKRLNQCEDY